VLLVFWALAFVVFLQFFTRYVLNDSLGWTEEIARFLLIAVTFMGAIMAVRKQSHIAVELLFRYMPRGLRRVLQAAIDLGLTVFYAALAWWCAALAGNTFQKMVSIDVPKAWLYWFVTACFALMAAAQALATWRHLRTGTSRLIDPDSEPPLPVE
jgi:TRAP-type C4-dicarboxylate transport system permease small subunit